MYLIHALWNIDLKMLNPLPREKLQFIGTVLIAGTLVVSFTFILVTRNYVDLFKSCKKFPPKAIVFGVTKSGTGALRMFLGAHPDVDNAPAKSNAAGVWIKPTVSFFDLHYEEGLQWYLSKMPCSEPDRMVVEHTPQYFKKQYVPKRIYMFNSTIKLLLILREPISRTVSQFLQMKDSRPKFDQLLDIDSFLLDESGRRVDTDNLAVSLSTYIVHLKKWLTVFDLDQMYIIDGNEFAINPLRQLQEIEKFLGLKPFFTSDIVYFNKTRGFHCVKTRKINTGYKCGGSKKGRTHPKLKHSTFNQLQKYFQPYNLRLFKTIGQVFNWTSSQ